MATPLNIKLENNYDGLVISSVSGSYSEIPVPVSNSEFLLDRDQAVQIRLDWTATGSTVAIHALLHLADWEGEAVLEAVSPSAVTASVPGAPIAFVAGAASMIMTFPAGTLSPGIYKLYVRVSMRDKVTVGTHYLPVNMVGESNPILVFDAI